MFIILNHLYLERKELFAEFSLRLILNLIPNFLHVLLDLPEMLSRSLQRDAAVLCNGFLLRFRSQLIHLPLLHADSAEWLLVAIS